MIEIQERYMHKFDKFTNRILNEWNKLGSHAAVSANTKNIFQKMFVSSCLERTNGVKFI